MSGGMTIKKAMVPPPYLALLQGKPGGIRGHGLLRKNPNIPLLPATTLTANIPLFKEVTTALAAVCVHKDQAQVFALTIAVLVDGSNSHDVILHIAENKEVFPSVVEHLNNLWGLLRDLRDSSDRSTSTISHAIYQHSFTKLRRRFNKRRDKFHKIYASVIEKHLSSLLSPQLPLFLELRRQLHNLGTIVNNNPPNITQLAFNAVLALYQQWKPYLIDKGHDSLLSTWDRAASQTRFSLRRYLQKLFTLYEHCLTICQIAVLPQLAPLLGGTLVIKPILSAHASVRVNLSENGVRHLILEAVPNLKEKDCHPIYKAIISRVPPFLRRDGTFNGTVHCECNLLAFHHQYHIPNVVNFIACSKLCCPACEILFRARNKEIPETHTPFYTMGSHNTLYPDWTAPVLNDQAPIPVPFHFGYHSRPLTLDEQVQRKMVTEYLRAELKNYVENIRKALHGDRLAKTISPESESTDDSGEARLG